MKLNTLVSFLQSEKMEIHDNIVIRYEINEKHLCLVIHRKNEWIYTMEKHQCRSVNQLGSFVEFYEDNARFELLSQEPMDDILVAQWIRVKQREIVTLHDSRISPPNMIQFIFVTPMDEKTLRVYGSFIPVEPNATLSWGSAMVSKLLAQVMGEPTTEMLLPSEGLATRSGILDPLLPNIDVNRKQISYLMDLHLQQTFTPLESHKSRFLSIDTISEWIETNPSDFFTPSDPSVRYLMIITSIRHHFTLTTIDVQERKILHYDSLAKNDFNELPEALLISQFARKIALVNNPGHFTAFTDWSAFDIMHNKPPHQTMVSLGKGVDFNCGLHACNVALDLAQGEEMKTIPLKYSPEQRRESAAQFRKMFQMMSRDPKWFKVEQSGNKTIFIPRLHLPPPVKIVSPSEYLIEMAIEANALSDRIIESLQSTRSSRKSEAMMQYFSA